MHLAFLNLGPMELIIVAIVGLLLFGRRLPEVGKNLGRSIVEFKKGLSSTTETEPKETDATPENKAAVPPSLPVKPTLAAGQTRQVKQIGPSDEP